MRRIALPVFCALLMSGLTRLHAIEEGSSLWSPRTYVDALNERISPFRLSGEYIGQIGHFSGDERWTTTFADFSLNERNYQVLFGPDKENTFDPRLFNRFLVRLDTDPERRYDLHLNLTFDPWSHTGKSSRIRLPTSTGDEVVVQHFYWSNTHRTLGSIYQTELVGDAITVPALYVQDGVAVSTRVNSLFAAAGGYVNTTTIPALSIQSSFQPVREAWVGWKYDETEFRLFPMAYEDQALTSNDPLKLSGNRIYWEPNPWTDVWNAGKFHLLPQDFSRGGWNKSIPFASRDSDGKFLTALRGFSIRHNRLDDPNSFSAVIASPKHLWQDYQEINSLPGALRKRFEIGEGNNLGMLYGFRFGFVDKRQDAFGQNIALDAQWTVLPVLKAYVEGALSTSKYDQTSEFTRTLRGSAWTAKLVSDLRFENSRWNEPGKMIMEMAYTQMTREFDPVLSNFRFTREDQFWGRHIYFDNPIQMRYETLFADAIGWNEIRGARIGDGVDIDRKVFRLHNESAFFENTLGVLLDFRDVRTESGRWLESVGRAEANKELFKRLTLKGMAVTHRMPNTRAGVDPIIFYQDRDRSNQGILNASIQEGKDPSLNTYAAGANLKILKWLGVHGIYERTNDWGAYPRALLSDVSFETFVVDGQTFRRPVQFLYSQNFFPLPPYPYYNIFKLGASFELEPWVYVDQTFTRSDNRWAGQIDENMNHARTTVSISPIKSVALTAEYAYTQAVNYSKQLQTGVVDYAAHHNYAAQAAWRINRDNELQVEYGIGAFATPFFGSTISPLGTGFPVLDTQDFIRIMFLGRF